MFDTLNTMRIRRRMVAIISVILILVTTISYIGIFDAFAAEEEQKVVPSRAPEVSANSYMVMSGSTSEKIDSRNATRKLQPGKMTYLMTAMVALDNMYNTDEFTNTVETGETIAEYGDTFKEGESASIGDLFYAMLVGGDVQAAELIAKYSASSRTVFVNEMNSKCMELGLMDTQFTNAGGRYDIKQYSTAADLAVIMQAALRYQEIKDALQLKEVTISATIKKDSRDIQFTATDPLLNDDPEQGYEFIKGGIMGTTENESDGTQFAAAATKDDMEIIVILMDSAKESAASDAKALLEYGDLKATKNTIIKKNKLAGHARVKGGASTRVAAYTETKGYAYVPPEGSDELIQTQVVMYDDLEAPLKAGDKVGEYRIFVADELKGTVDLIIKHDVPAGWYPSRFYISNRATVILGALIALVLLFFMRVAHVRRRRARKRAALRRARVRELAMRQMEIDADRQRRAWTGSGYEPMPPRTTDIRKESISKEAEKKGLRYRSRRKNRNV